MNDPIISGKGPRPLEYVRIRVHRGGQASYLRDLLEDEREALYEDIGKMRERGLPDESPEVQEAAANLRHLINILRDLSTGMIELAGPGGY